MKFIGTGNPETPYRVVSDDLLKWYGTIGSREDGFIARCQRSGEEQRGFENVQDAAQWLLDQEES